MLVPLDNLIDHWKTSLQYDKFLMSPSVQLLVEETVKALVELKGLLAKERGANMVCPKCGAPAERTDWTPPPGIDPMLVEYKCSDRGHIFYALTGKREHHQGVTVKTFNKPEGG